MERCEQREKQVEKEFDIPMSPAATGEGESETLSPKTPPFARLETVLLKQIVVCIFIIFFLWAIGKIRVGTGVKVLHHVCIW